MKLVDEKPKNDKCRRKRILPIIEEFMKMNVKRMKLEYTKEEYKDANSCNAAMWKALHDYYSNYPVRVRRIAHEVFLERTDM